MFEHNNIYFVLRTCSCISCIVILHTAYFLSQSCNMTSLLELDFAKLIKVAYFQKVFHFGSNLPKNVPNRYPELYSPKEKMLRIFLAHLLGDWSHGLRTPNEGINQRNLKIWTDVADKICFGRT